MNTTVSTTTPPGVQDQLTTPWSDTEHINTVIIGAVITILVVSILCLAGLVCRYMHHQKGSYITYEHSSEEDVTSLRIKEIPREEKMEYFM
ncbi:uncharacterized protein LOC103171621 [Callorhinchus milii]|uniref:Small cell adhesion glycoprotein-like protein n=1 Tax=Callorhinchus milii TaxID=7868 RepID=V9LEU9_CALMI|nr:uncharacterized protein LOC103171621 [Callorhinchus milii]|eukprot:gi/632987516/ref/XP_007882602.1/ PREDICTED: small cell adhesion glycoprotein [Callorhinchus milii]